jgi:hypothetical protein
MTSPYSYGGALTEESTTYVKRDADDQLFDALKSGKFCYVLESRQTGKSSLRVQIMKRLKEEDIYYFSYDLSKQGTSAKNDEEWYQDQIKNCISNFWQNYNIDLLNKDTKLDKVSIKLKEWWEARPGSNLGKYEDFLEGCLLKNIQGNIVFFIDEIDSVINLPFSVDDFFGFIRGCHEDRTIKKQYQRLTFCLMGVASPDKLIKNIDKTPFNFGTAVTLSPFPNDLSNEKSFEMMKPLLNGGLEDKDILQEILRWTGGQPFLTQKLCDLIVQERRNNSSNTVEEVVNSKIINNWFVQDEPVHLKTIQKRFDQRSKDKQLAFRSLGLYKKILENQSLNVNVDNSQEEESELKLSGLVLQQNNILKPYNPIYTKIFDVNWVEAEMRKIRLFSNELDSWKNEDKRKKQLHLLYRKKYEDAKQWREEFKQYGGDDKDETNFIDQSSQFWEAIQRAFPQGFDHELIINSMNDWTSGFDDFNDKILQIAINDHNEHRYLTRGDRLKALVEENLKDFEEYDQFRKDRDHFLNQEDASIDSFALISTFEQIAQKEPVPFNEKNPQHRKLQAMCFIILDKEHNLRIINKIYEKLLNQDWIKSVIEQIRPYTKPFQKWKDSGKSHDYVLQSNNLKLALKWLGKKPTPKLEVLEIEFVMTSLVAEVWATASPFVQSEAISLIITFRPSLQGKNNYSDFLLREILQWTKSQTPALEKLLEWVNESEIPVKNNREWLASLARSHIKSWNCQKLFDFSLALHSSQKEKDREVFVFFDEYLGMNNPQGVITEETRREYEKILDKYQKSQENDFQFQKLVLTFLKRKFARICLMSKQKPEQEKLDVLLDEIVIGSRRHLKSVLIFNLDNGLPLYHNKQLKSDDPDLYHALFADGGDAVGEAIEGFESLSKIQEALDNFGSVTTFGNLIYSIFKLEEGTMMVYFLKLTTSFAICFIAPDGINLGLVVTRSQSKIKNIENELKELGF